MSIMNSGLTYGVKTLQLNSNVDLALVSCNYVRVHEDHPGQPCARLGPIDSRSYRIDRTRPKAHSSPRIFLAMGMPKLHRFMFDIGRVAIELY